MQDSLPAAGPALPGGIGYPQGSCERFHGCNDSPFPSFLARCQFIILARKDELTPDYSPRKDELTPDYSPRKDELRPDYSPLNRPGIQCPLIRSDRPSKTR